MHTSRRGFTLVELSIVLVIIGLLAGGIMAGKNLLRASQVRGIIGEIQGYSLAMQHFKDKYGELPGDFSQATRIWGRADGGTDVNSNCASPATDNAVPAGTCNGDGNGQIGDNMTAGAEYEDHRFWQQLALAGLISGSYTGIAGPGGNLQVVPGVNSPISRLDNAGYGAEYISLPAGTAIDFPIPGTHMLWIGGKDINNLPGMPIMTPREAAGIDTKIDDGKPGSGAVTTWRSGSSVPHCTNTNAALTPDADAAQAIYRLDLDSLECALRVNMDQYPPH